MSCAVPKPAPAGGGVLVATAAPMTVAASATTMSARTSVCWRHSRRNIRHDQRITARRAGTPPFDGSRLGRPFAQRRAHWPGPCVSSDSGPGTGSVWSVTRPSRRNTTRSAHEASCASWVTTTAATPRLQAA